MSDPKKRHFMKSWKVWLSLHPTRTLRRTKKSRVKNSCVAWRATLLLFLRLHGRELQSQKWQSWNHVCFWMLLLTQCVQVHTTHTQHTHNTTHTTHNTTHTTHTTQHTTRTWPDNRKWFAAAELALGVLVDSLVTLLGPYRTGNKMVIGKLLAKLSHECYQDVWEHRHAGCAGLAKLCNTLSKRWYLFRDLFWGWSYSQWLFFLCC